MFSHSTTDIISGVNFLPDTYYTRTRNILLAVAIMAQFETNSPISPIAMNL